MGNSKYFSILFVILFSGVMSGQISPNIIWEVQAFPDKINYISISEDGNTILASNLSISNFYDSTGQFIDSYVSGHGIAGSSLSPTAEYFTVGYQEGIMMRGYSLVVKTADHTVLTTIKGNLSIFSKDESRLVTAERAMLAYIYNIPNWYSPIIIDNTFIYINSIDISADYIAIGFENQIVKLRDITTGDSIHTFTGFTNWVSVVKFSPDGSILASGQGKQQYYSDGAIKIWNMNDYSLIADLDAFGDRTNSITFSPDGLYMIAAGQDGDYSSNFPKIKIWRTSDWTLLKTYDSNLDNEVTAVHNLPDSYKLVYATGQGHLVLADYTEIVTKEAEVNTLNPIKFTLVQNYPNPFNPTTDISFSIPEPGNAKLAVYDILGQEVAVLVNGILNAGRHDVTFNASSLPGGVYFYRLQADNSIMVKKMILLK
jgi:WD40 repeat protein